MDEESNSLRIVPVLITTRSPIQSLRYSTGSMSMLLTVDWTLDHCSINQPCRTTHRVVSWSSVFNDGPETLSGQA